MSLTDSLNQLTQNLPSFFDPCALSDKKQNNLLTRLDTLESLTTEREALRSEAALKSLQKGLNGAAPIGGSPSPARMAFEGIPADRISKHLNTAIETATTDAEKQTFRELSSRPPSEQKDLIAFMVTDPENHLNPRQERRLWQAIDRSYRGILEDFPNIQNTRTDLQRAQKAGSLLLANQDAQNTEWRGATPTQRAQLLVSSLAQAMGQDTKNLHVTSMPNLRGASFSRHFDTITIGQGITAHDKPDLAQHMLYHELSHRHQSMLAADLSAGKIGIEHPAYFQARLFRANLEGGYLSATEDASKLTRLAKMDSYQEQPIESNANQMARLFSINMLSPAANLMRKIQMQQSMMSDLAKPVEAVRQTALSVKSSVTSLAQRISPSR